MSTGGELTNKLLTTSALLCACALERREDEKNWNIFFFCSSAFATNSLEAGACNMYPLERCVFASLKLYILECCLE